jgi:hypothetical protein
MRRTAGIKLFVVMIAIGLLLTFGLGSRPSHAQTPPEQQPQPSQEKPGEQTPAGQQAPETTKVLKGMTRQQIMAEMRK